MQCFKDRGSVTAGGFRFLISVAYSFSFRMNSGFKMEKVYKYQSFQGIKNKMYRYGPLEFSNFI